MTCPKCGTKTRSRTTACPTCGHRSRRYRWFVVPFAIALIAFIAVVTNAYFKDSSRSADSLADKVRLNVTDDTVSVDAATPADLDALQDSLFTVSNGTGFLISPQDVLTAASNVAGLTDIILERDGNEIAGTVVGRNDAIAVIRIEQVDLTPFSFTQAIAASDESLLTMTSKDRINGTVTFSETGYERNFDLPRYAIGSPLLTENGRVLAIHLRELTLPVILFEQDVQSFLESDTPAPPTAELAPVAPISPLPKEAPVTEAPAPAPAEETTPAPETPAEPEAPAEPAEPAPAVEEPVEATPPPEEEAPAEPAPPEEPVTEPEPPVTEPPPEPETPVTEPAEPVEPEKPAADTEKPVKKQDNKPTDKPKTEPPVKEDKPKSEESKEDPAASSDEPVDEESTPSE